jgi:putative transposase
LLRKIAKEPISVLGSVQEILPLVQSQLHDYPALSAIAQAIATEKPDPAQPQISSEQYQAEIERLEAAEEKQKLECHQQIALNVQLEKLFEFWQLGGNFNDISSEKLAEVATYLDSSAGRGYLGALCDREQQEYRFRSWLVGDPSKQPDAIDSNQLLMVLFEKWSKGLEACASERDFIAHYVQLAAGKGTLEALIEDKYEQQRFCKWLSRPETVTL